MKIIRHFPLKVNVFLIIFISLLAGACGPNEPIRLGFIGGLTGRGADLGIAARDGVQIAVDQYNQAGGVNGREVVLLVMDDKHDVHTAQQTAQRLIDQEVSAIIGPMTSAMAMALLPVINQAKMVCVSPTVTTEDLSGKDDYFLRISGITKIFAAKNANYQLKAKTMRRVAAVYDLGNRSFSENWINNFGATLARGGGELVIKKGFTSGEVTSFIQFAKDLLVAKPDGVVIAANAVDASLLCQQIRKLDAALPITLSDWAAQERLIEMGGKAVEGVTVIQTFDRDNKSPRYQKFRSIYTKRFGREPGSSGVYGYDAAKLVLDALARKTDGKSLKQVILSEPGFEGLQGEHTMDQFGDAKNAKCSISIVKDGRFVVVE